MKIMVVIPAFNHAGTLPGVVSAVRAAMAAAGEALPLTVVNDGSTDGTGKVLEGEPGVTVLTHARNRGKGAALMTGFVHAAREGYTHVLTVDADGQHDPADAVRLVHEARAHPEELIIGERDMEACAGEVPLRSRQGRNASRFWLRIQTGQWIPDSQCGLRVYPLMQVLAVPQRFERYDYETEILARLSWGGVKIRGVPVRCIYFPEETRVSHFRPWCDTLRGVRANMFLIGRRLLPMPFRRLVKRPQESGFAFGAWWRWSTWREAVRESLRAGASNAELAMAFAMGIFIGLTPFYLVQTILAIYFGRRLHLNVVAAVIGSQISIPPLAPFWGTLSYATGWLLLHGEWIFADAARPSAVRPTMVQNIGTFLVGNALVAVAMALMSLFAARAVLHCFRTERNAQRV